MGKKKTHEEFVRELEEKKPGKFKLHSKYISDEREIEAECLTCGHKWTSSPKRLLTYKCPECAKKIRGRKRRLSQEEIEKRIHNLYNGTIIIGEYVNKEAPIDAECLICGNKWRPKAGNLMRGHGCIHCRTKSVRQTLENILTDEAFKTELEKRHEGKFEVISEFKGINEDIQIKCKKCGHEFIKTARKVIEFGSCPACYNWEVNPGFNDLATIAPEVLKYFDYEKNYPIAPDKIIAKSHAKIWWKCPDCGYSFQRICYDMIWEKKNCPACVSSVFAPGINDLETKYPDIAKEWDYKKNGDLTPRDVFPMSAKKVWWICPICGCSWETSVASKVRHPGSCPECSESSGEKVVRKALDTGGVTYKMQYTFPGCKNKVVLRFDLCVLKKNVVLGLIEYDGEQHFKPIDYFGGEEGFQYRQECDSIKNKYCKDNNIPLLRIPYTYTEKEVKDSVAKFLKQIGAVG